MTGQRLPDARDVSRMLAATMPALVAELLPASKRHGNEAVIGSIRGEPGRSMSICIAGPRAGLWADFSAGMKGDALDLAGAVLGLDKAAAWRWGLRRLGYTPPGDAPGTQAAPPTPPPPDTTQQDQAAAADAERRQRQARAIFAEAEPLTPASPPALYAKMRGMDLAELGRVPRALRYHPALWCSEAGAALPALIGAIMSLDGTLQGVHRIWLAPDPSAGTWRKAPLISPKKALGSVTGGCIPIWRGTAAAPLREAPEGGAVVLCEGIEDALAIALLAPELRVLAVVSLANMASVALPASIATVILAADNDAPGSPAALALQRAVDAHAAAGRDVRIARSPTGKDFADALAASTEGDA
jgi:hypothetical protein